MIKAAIAGASSANAGELIRLLVNHPDVDIRVACAPEYAGHRVSEIHAGLTGETSLCFTDKVTLSDIDVLFLCQPRGEAQKFMERNQLPPEVRVIDLSGDFRLENSGNDFVYGLPELHRKELVRGATKAAVPGALATAVCLALLPLARHLMLNRTLRVTALTPASGDDIANIPLPASAPEFCNPLANAQTEEMLSILRKVQSSFASDIETLTVRGSHDRGMAVMIYLDSPVPADTVIPLYDNYYDDHNFTFVTPRRPRINDVAGTNKCLLHIENIGGKLLVTAVIDNILKGGAGQAVHIMNLLFGLHERVGLQLKSAAI